MVKTFTKLADLGSLVSLTEGGETLGCLTGNFLHLPYGTLVYVHDQVTYLFQICEWENRKIALLLASTSNVIVGSTLRYCVYPAEEEKC